MQNDGVVYCNSCGRAYSRSVSTSIVAHTREHVLATSLSRLRVCYPWLGPHRAGLLADAGIVTIGDALRAGESVLDIDGIGPRTLDALDATYERVWEYELDMRGATSTPHTEAAEYGREETR
jgi:hypothetical protein